MLKFVLLRHEMPPETGRASHFDLMLQVGEVLATWEIPAVPQAGKTYLVGRLPDHRLHYLEYEGPISGGRGEVSKMDAGELVWREQLPESLVAEVRGKILSGTLELTRDSLGYDRSDAQANLWKLVYRAQNG